MNTKVRGGIAMGAAINYFLSRGNQVFVPVVDSGCCDMIVDDGQVKRVQVKYTSRFAGSSHFLRLARVMDRTSKTYVPYKTGDFDLLFVYCEDGCTFLLPPERVIGKHTICLRHSGSII